MHTFVQNHTNLFNFVNNSAQKRLIFMQTQVLFHKITQWWKMAYKKYLVLADQTPPEEQNVKPCIASLKP